MGACHSRVRIGDDEAEVDVVQRCIDVIKYLEVLTYGDEKYSPWILKLRKALSAADGELKNDSESHAYDILMSVLLILDWLVTCYIQGDQSLETLPKSVSQNFQYTNPKRDLDKSKVYAMDMLRTIERNMYGVSIHGRYR